MRPAIRFAAALLAAAGAAGCTVLTTTYDPLIGAEDADVPAGTTYPETLARLGPPARAGRVGSGFALMYEPLETREDQLGFSLGGRAFAWLGLGSFFDWVKLAVARGVGTRETLLVVFDSDGRAVGTAYQARDENLGFSSAVQFLVAIESAIDTSHLELAADPNQWGRRMLDPLPRTLNRASSLDHGAHGLEQRGTTGVVGQHALEQRGR